MFCLWELQEIAEYYLFATTKMIKLELEGHCEHLPSGNCESYANGCCGDCEQALRRADHQGESCTSRKQWAIRKTSLWTSQLHLLQSRTTSERSVLLQTKIPAGSWEMSKASSQQAPDVLTDHLDKKKDRIRIFPTTYLDLVVPYVSFYVESHRFKYQYRSRLQSDAHHSL